jgi:hypothetical protein
LPAPDADREDRHRQREIAHAGLGRVKLSDQTEEPERREKRQQDNHPYIHYITPVFDE